jgi:hypothetical protein
MVWSAVVALLFGRGSGAGEPWRAVEQPELKQALEQAPALPVESLGESSRGVNTWQHWLVPNPDGKSWDVLQIYFWLKEVLVRIGPTDVSVRIVGKVDPVGWLTFVGRDLYLSGSEQLRRIRKVAPLDNAGRP